MMQLYRFFQRAQEWTGGERRRNLPVPEGTWSCFKENPKIRKVYDVLTPEYAKSAGPG